MDFNNRWIEIVVDGASTELRTRALQIQKEHPGMNFGDALRQARGARYSLNFNENEYLKVDPASVELRARAIEIQANSDPKVSFGEALRQARRQ